MGERKELNPLISRLLFWGGFGFNFYFVLEYS